MKTDTDTAAKLTPEAADAARLYLTDTLGLTPEAAEPYGLAWADAALHRHLVEDLGMASEDCVLAPVWDCYNEDAFDIPGCIIVESPLDSIALREWGYPALAVYGTDCLQLIECLIERRGLPQDPVYVCFHGAPTSSDSAFEVATILGPEALIVELPQDLSPADLFRDGRRDDFERSLARAHRSLWLRIMSLRPDFAPEQRARELDSIIPGVGAYDESRIEYCITTIAGRLELTSSETDQLRRAITATGSAMERTDSTAAGPYSALFDGLIDLCEHNGASAFLLHSGPVWHGLVSKPCDPSPQTSLSSGAAKPSTHQPQVATQADVHGASVTPPPAPRIPWLLPRADQVLHWVDQDDDETLFHDLVAYHESVSELPGPYPYDLLAAWTMHTYLLESCEHSPILYLYGGPERGKTRTGRAIAHVAYRGFHVESLREACLTRIARDYRATLFIDINDLARRLARQRAGEALRQRFEKGAIVPRALHPLRGPYEDMEYLPVFGATVIGTNAPPEEDLRTRSLVFPMPSSLPASGLPSASSRSLSVGERLCPLPPFSSGDADRPSFNTPITPDLALPLKERLVAFRARHLASGLPAADRPFNGRFGDISLPLIQAVRLACPAREQRVLEALSHLHAHRLQHQAQSVESIILSAMTSLSSSVKNGLLPLKSLTAAINLRHPDNGHWHPKRIASCLWRLGFSRAPLAGNKTAVVWDDYHLAHLCAVHGTPAPDH